MLSICSVNERKIIYIPTEKGKPLNELEVDNEESLSACCSIHCQFDYLVRAEYILTGHGLQVLQTSSL
jgi:hypothetical protein